ncbi:LacI family DNA-binding transcriptional regulator [Nocardioides halotolerans]|uniref:LacI family DNA-binding transcriptional regulator n=1 Tax=Nocardioides halotolerans TaxID=433660 RepID=UPI0004128C02|nr:LacI family DNA-binding transcriptional regulator [Nocardioides halotolerans]
MAKVTLQSIADHVGVSRMTVSNAFSRPDQLSADLRAKILAAADQLGYVGPDPAARALARGRTGSVGLLLTDELSQAFEDAVATEFLSSVAGALTHEGLALTLLTSGDVAGAPSGYVPSRDVAMDGAIVYICDPASPDIAWLERRGLPLVAVDRDPAADAPSVNVDDRGGATAAAQHLVDLGHTRVAILTLRVEGVPKDNRPARERLVGWRAPLEAAGIEPEVCAASYRRRGTVEQEARALLDRPGRPTAILCFSDAFAVATIQVAHSLGLRVPEDLSVVGYDDSPLALASQPQLTTVHQEVASKGHEAVRLLMGVMGTNPPEEPERVLLPTRLVIRDSTAPPPA